MSQHVPDMGRGTSLRDATPGAIYHASDSGALRAPQFVAVPPAQTTGEIRGSDGRKKKVTGLVPAIAGSTFALVVRDRPTERVTPREIGQIRAELRKADAACARIEHELIQATLAGGADSDAAKEKLKDARVATDRAAIFRRKLAEAESSSKGRPTQVHLAIVHEPAEVPDALASADSPPVVVCLHDGCRGQRWEDEAEMRRAHPTNAEMARTQQAHVYVYLSDAPADPLDPDGPKIGYIAPTGRDGTTVRQTIATADEGLDDVGEMRARMVAQDERNANLEAQLADLKALVEGLAKVGKK